MLTPTLLTAVSVLRDIQSQGIISPREYPLSGDDFFRLLHLLCAHRFIEPIAPLSSGGLSESASSAYRLLHPYETLNLFELMLITGESLDCFWQQEDEDMYYTHPAVAHKLGALRQVINHLLERIRVEEFYH